jgi:hypothetical protein
MTEQEFLQQLGEEKVKAMLKEVLDECLKSNNQDGHYEVVKVDLKNQRFTVEFDIVAAPEDDYVGFCGY